MTVRRATSLLTLYIAVANLGGDEPGTTSPPDDQLVAVEKDLALAVVCSSG